MFTHLHVRSWFSFLNGGSSPGQLALRAAAQGMQALALTDVNGVYGAVQFQKACAHMGIKPIFGAEVHIAGGTHVLLAKTGKGYANLCRILTGAHLDDREAPHVSIETLSSYAHDLICLTGGREGTVWRALQDRHYSRARRHLERLKDVFGAHLFVELVHYMRPGDSAMIHRLFDLAKQCGINVVAAGDVRYAEPSDYRRYDLLTCIRLGQTVFEPHPERPVNAESCLKSEQQLRRLIPYGEAFEHASAIAESCHVDLISGAITPPAANVPEGRSAEAVLREICRNALRENYEANRLNEARRQLSKELNVITSLELEEFFLVVQEIVQEARRRGIRCAGRGSAANSIVSYLLGITAVDPLEHKLLFERFLHGGRKGMPDIDVDFDSERREEVIAWMEERFGMEQTAMTATVVRYQLRSALRDAAKALGWPLDVVDRMCAQVPGTSARRISVYRVALEGVTGKSPMLDVLIEMVEGFYECPRHLGQHSGGMVLSRVPLYNFTPLQVSANGVKVVQFDKDDIEDIGLVKLDILGLRMLATVSEAEELVHRHEETWLDVNSLALDDIRTFNLIRAGQTIGCFQIESQGQLHLLAINQPDTFQDLIAEIALFRPGPLQGNMVKPFVRRRRGRDKIEYDHPDLEPILQDTYGIILFQEQVLDVVHRFAGLSMEEADEFRRLMSKFRDPGQMDSMRDRFVEKVVGRGISEEIADRVFQKISKFVGFGFCRSHAAAFAKTVYQSAYLKCHHPAAFMASVMQHRPGMYNQMTLEEEARRCGVATLLPDINRSTIRFDLERLPEGALAIRKPLTSVNEVSTDASRFILWERLQRPFTSVEDLYRRVPLERESLDALARSGALDAIAGNSRKALWEVGVLARRIGTAGRHPTPALFDIPVLAPEDIPVLPELDESERLSWDYVTHHAARLHPMTLVRRQMNELEIRPIDICYRLPRSLRRRRNGKNPIIMVAGIVALRQRPASANGVMFVTLEDETGFIQCVVFPTINEMLDHVLTRASLIIRGELQTEGNWRGIVVQQAWALDQVFGGYGGYPSASGGRDRWIRQLTSGKVEG